MRLSPLNLSGMMADLNATPVTESASTKPRRKAESVLMWRCAECFDMHDDEDSANECCETADASIPPPMACPVCQAKYGSFQDASDCCLWKDIPALDRWRIAAAVEAGSNWADELL